MRPSNDHEMTARTLLTVIAHLDQAQALCATVSAAETRMRTEAEQAQIEAFFTQPLSDRTALDVKLRSLEAEWESLAVSGAELRPRPRACASSASFMRGEGAMWNEGGVFVTR